MKTKIKLTDGGSALFELNVATQRTGPFVFERDIPSEWLTRELNSCEYSTAPSSGSVKLDVEPTSGGYLIRGDARAALNVECAVCLSSVLYEVSAKISTFMVPKAAIMGYADGIELTLEDLETECFDGDSIVLDGLLRDSILLELPMNPKCGDSCPGLKSSDPIHDSNFIDQRLLPLSKIVLEKEK